MVKLIGKRSFSTNIQIYSKIWRAKTKSHDSPENHMLSILNLGAISGADKPKPEPEF